MPKIHVHDFYFEYSAIENTADEADFCCSVNIYYNFSLVDPGGGWDNLEYFNITVASPFGFAKYIKKCIASDVFNSSFFYPHLLIFEKNDKEAIKSFIKRELESIQGKSENELLLKAIRKFDWEGEQKPEIYNKIFR